MVDKNLEWIAGGNTACNFATLFARNPECIGWKRIQPIDFLHDGIPQDALIVSIVFDKDTFDKDSVREFALDMGFYEEETGEGLVGLRYNCPQGKSWVQYFGPDFHVKTRQAPQPELLFTVKLPAKYYFKVGFNGILHLAHAAVDCILPRKADKLWETSFKTTAKKIGHSPTIVEAAKTTFKDGTD